MSEPDPFSDLPSPSPSIEDGGIQPSALDLEGLAAHFEGYELEPLITVSLKPVDLVLPMDGLDNPGGRS